MDDLVNAGKAFEPRSVDASVIPDEPHGGALIAGHGLRLIAHLLDDGDDFLDFIGRCAMPHHDQHNSRLPSPIVKRSPSFAANTGPPKWVPASFAGSEVSTGG